MATHWIWLAPSATDVGVGEFAELAIVSQQESDDLFERWTIPSPARPLFQLALGNLTPHSAAPVDSGNQSRGPRLLLSGKLDHTVPDVLTRSAYRQYRHSSATTEYQCFDDRGHSLIVDSGWPKLAETSLAWLRNKNLAATP